MKPIHDAQLKQVGGGLLPSGPEGPVAPGATTTVAPDPSLTYQNAWAYAQQRKQFGRRICGHQTIRNLLIEARTRLAACRHMLYHAAWLATEGRDCSVESSMAKLFVAENAVAIVLWTLFTLERLSILALGVMPYI